MLVQVHSLRIVFSANPEPRAMAKEAYRSRPLKTLLRSYIMVSFSSFQLSFCGKHVIYNHLQYGPLVNMKVCSTSFTKLTKTTIARGRSCVVRPSWSQTTRPVKVIRSRLVPTTIILSQSHNLTTET